MLLHLGNGILQPWPSLDVFSARQPDIVCGLVRALLYRRCYYIILTKQRRVSGQEGTTIHFEKVLHKPSSMDISGYLSCMHFCDLCNKHNYLCCRISWLVTRVFYLIPVLRNLSMFKLLNRYLIFWAKPGKNNQIKFMLRHNTTSRNMDVEWKRLNWWTRIYSHYLCISTRDIITV